MELGTRASSMQHTCDNEGPARPQGFRFCVSVAALFSRSILAAWYCVALAVGPSMRPLLSSIRASQIAMAKLKPEPRFVRRRVRLTAEEFASLKEVGNRPMQRSIPNEHRDRLIAVGYVREIVPY